MDFYEEYYRKNGLLEKLTKEAINISKYHKSKEYQALSSKEQEDIEKEEEELNKAIKSQMTFYPYGSQELMGDEKLLKKTYDVLREYLKHNNSNNQHSQVKESLSLEELKKLQREEERKQLELIIYDMSRNSPHATGTGE